MDDKDPMRDDQGITRELLDEQPGVPAIKFRHPCRGHAPAHSCAGPNPSPPGLVGIEDIFIVGQAPDVPEVPFRKVLKPLRVDATAPTHRPIRIQLLNQFLRALDDIA